MSYVLDTMIGDGTDDGADLLALIEAELTAHAAWTFIEEVNGYRIWESDGTLNSLGQDFYVMFNASGNNLNVGVAEGYDSGTDTFTNPAYGSPYNTLVQADGGAGDFPASTSTSYLAYVSFNLGAGTYDYVIGVSADHIVIYHDDHPYPIDLGMFDPFFPSAPNEHPLMVGELGNSDSDGAGSFTRCPGAEGTSPSDTFSQYDTPSILQFTDLDGDINGGYEHYGSAGNPRPLGSRLLAKHSISNVAQYRGLHKDLLMFNSPGIQMGDTIQVDGEQYVYMAHDIWLNTTID